MADIPIINAGFPKEGTPESHAYWAEVRKKLPRFTYEPPKVVHLPVPVEHAEEVRRFLAALEAGKSSP